MPLQQSVLFHRVGAGGARLQRRGVGGGVGSSEGADLLLERGGCAAVEGAEEGDGDRSHPLAFLDLARLEAEAGGPEGGEEGALPRGGGGGVGVRSEESVEPSVRLRRAVQQIVEETEPSLERVARRGVQRVGRRRPNARRAAGVVDAAVDGGEEGGEGGAGGAEGTRGREQRLHLEVTAVEHPVSRVESRLHLLEPPSHQRLAAVGGRRRAHALPRGHPFGAAQPPAQRQLVRVERLRCELECRAHPVGARVGTAAAAAALLAEGGGGEGVEELRRPEPRSRLLVARFVVEPVEEAVALGAAAGEQPLTEGLALVRVDHQPPEYRLPKHHLLETRDDRAELVGRAERR